MISLQTPIYGSKKTTVRENDILSWNLVVTFLNRLSRRPLSLVERCCTRIEAVPLPQGTKEGGTMLLRSCSVAQA